MNLNRLQKRIIIAGLLVLGLMTLVVPWANAFSGVSRGYRPLFLPPEMGRVDTIRLLVPLGLVTVATLAGVVLAGSKTPEKPK